MTAFVPIWRRPWMALGMPTYGASLLAHLGVATVFGDDGPYPTIELEDAIVRHPDVVLAPSEPYPFTRRQLPELSVGRPHHLRRREGPVLVGGPHPGRHRAAVSRSGRSVNPGHPWKSPWPIRRDRINENSVSAWSPVRPGSVNT